jgi:hypothetical protein
MASINMPSRRPDALERLAQGLGIAHAVLGIGQTIGKAATEAEERAKLLALDDPNSQASKSEYKAQSASGLKVPEGLSANQYKANRPIYEKAFEHSLKGMDAPAYAVSQEKVGSWLSDGAKLVPPGTKGAAEFTVTGSDGKPKLASVLFPPKSGKTGEGAAGLTAPKPPTESQSKAALFGKRLQQAEGVFGELEGAGYNRADNMSAVEAAVAPGPFKGENLKRWEQAERNFINAVLRRESGAVISDEEYANAELQYFPRAGDTEAVRKQKAENRALALAALEAEAADAWGRIEAKQANSGSVAKASPRDNNDTVKKATAGSGRVVVSNGKETYSIELTDLPEALKDGFKVAK